MKRWWSFFLSLLLFSGALVGCSTGSNGSNQTQTSSSKVVNLVMWSSPDTFNPYFSQGNYGKYAGGELVLSTLLKYNPQFQLIPSLAKSYKVSGDGKTYTFNLQENAKWHDGKPFTANDVAFTFKSIMDPAWTGTGYTSLSLVKGAADYKAGKTKDVPGIQVVDDHTIKIELTKPYAPFLEAVGKGLWILPAHNFDGVKVADFAKADFSRKPNGTGPLKFVQYVTDQYVEYAANKDYYLGAPKFDKLILKIMTPDVALAAFQKGEIDATTRVGLGTLSVSDYDKAKQIQSLDITPFKTMSYQTITVNTAKPYLADARVREAIAYGIDRQGIVDKLLQGKATVAKGPLAENSPWFDNQLPDVSYNPAKAKELLKAAGWDPNTKVVISVPKGNIIRERSAPIIQQDLKNIGMNVDLQFMDFATLMSQMEKKSLDMALLGMDTGMIDPDSNLYPFYDSAQVRPTGWNTANYANTQIDQLLDKGAVETDPNKRKQIYDQVQEIAVNDMPYVFLYYEQAIGATNKRLKNAVPNPVGIEWNIQDWELQ